MSDTTGLPHCLDGQHVFAENTTHCQCRQTITPPVRLPAVDATTAAPNDLPPDFDLNALYDAPAAASPVVDTSETLKDSLLDERASAAAPATVALSGYELDAEVDAAMEDLEFAAREHSQAKERFDRLLADAKRRIPVAPDPPSDDPPRAADATPSPAVDQPLWGDEQVDAINAACEALWNSWPADNPIHTPRPENHPLYRIGTRALAALNSAEALHVAYLALRQQVGSLTGALEEARQTIAALKDIGR